MTSPLIERAEQHEYQQLFLHDLNWSRPDQAPVTEARASARSSRAARWKSASSSPSREPKW